MTGRRNRRLLALVCVLAAGASACTDDANAPGLADTNLSSGTPTATATSSNPREALVMVQVGQSQSAGLVMGNGSDFITANHSGGAVVGAPAIVTFSDGSTTSATVIGIDSRTSLVALHAAVPHTSTTATLAENPVTSIGDRAIMVTTQTAPSDVVVRGTNVIGEVATIDVEPVEPTPDLTQPAGAAMVVNAGGEVLGIVIATASDSGVSTHFILPSDLIQLVASAIFEGRPAIHPSLGLVVSDAASVGAQIDRVTPAGPGSNAGLAPGDVIIRIGQVEVETAADVVAAVQGHMPGDDLEIALTRDGVQTTVAVELGVLP